jgi:O-glycosyl hydrolase
MAVGEEPMIRRFLAAALLALSALMHPPVAATQVLEVTLHPERERQTIRGFGASDAWSLQFVGRDWPVAKRERIADLLFSTGARPDGSPLGIGLSEWRFNVGAGSAAQGAESGIRDAWRRAESFLQPDGSYDWERHAGQRWFLRAARDRGVARFTAFVNSPPIALTRNGRAFSSGGDSANLAPERYGDFARFLRDVVTHLERSEGVRFEHVSPVNEPQWDWKGGQEGSPWMNGEVRGLAAVLGSTFREAGLATRIEIAEAGKLNYLYEEADKPGRGDQVAAFFGRSSPLYLGGLPNVARSIAAHSYWTTFPTSSLVEVRTRLRERLRAVDPALELRMTEYCFLETNPEVRGSGRDLGIDPALYLARVVHADLTIAEASSWSWWLAVSPYDYKDGLVYIDRDMRDGEVYESKTLWALGHFSRFVRPGMKRIEVDASGPADLSSGVLVSAYRDPAGPGVVAVLVNQDGADASVRLRGAGSGRARYYRTSAAAGENLTLAGSLDSSGVLMLPARSLTTVVWQ